MVHESWPYRLLRGASIQLNRLMFAAIILLAVWLVWSAASGTTACQETVRIEGGEDAGTTDHCSVWLGPTSTYLAVVAVLSFVGSIVFGLLGLVVGKQVLALTPADEEVGARKEQDQEEE